MRHSILCVFPVDAIKTHTRVLTLAGPRYVKGTSPPSAAEKNQIILSGDTGSFRHGGDGASSPLPCLHLSASFWLYLTLFFYTHSHLVL